MKRYTIFMLILVISLAVSCDKPDITAPNDNKEQTENNDNENEGGNENGTGNKDDDKPLEGEDEGNPSQGEDEKDGNKDDTGNENDDKPLEGEDGENPSQGEDEKDGNIHPMAKIMGTPLPNEIRYISLSALAITPTSATWNVSIESNVYDNKSGRGIITFSDTLSELPEGAFNECQFLSAISLPSGVRAIGVKAFQKCVNLQYIGLPENLETVGYWAFQDCSSLQTLTLPEGPPGVTPESFQPVFRVLNSASGHGTPPWLLRSLNGQFLCATPGRASILINEWVSLWDQCTV